MLNTAFKRIYPVILCLLLTISISSGAAENYDTAELNNGDNITGTLLNETLTLSTPYSLVTLEKDKILEIRINPEKNGHDVIELKAGGLLEGTLDDTEFSFKSASGEDISIKKEQCKKIILK